MNLLKLSAFRHHNSRKGSILIITLWSLCLLSVFAVIIGYQTRQQITVVKRLDEKEKLRLIGEAGIRAAIMRLAEGEEKDYDALNDSWSNNTGMFKGFRVGDGISDISYDYIDEKTCLPGTRYGLIDEQRKININKADRTVMERLFKITAGLDEMEAQELAASIVDWRDADGNLSIPLGSAEGSYYRNTQYPYEAKNAEFEILEEVLLVKGMTNQIFEKIKDYITIYGDGKVNINTTSKIVLLALGTREDMADKVIALLYGKNGIRGDADDIIFDSPFNIIPKIGQAYQLSASDVAQFNAIADQNLVTKSDFFMIKNTASLKAGKVSAATVCVVDRAGKILYWREG